MGLDLLVEDKVIVELKAKEHLPNLDEAQLFTLCKAS